MSYTLAVDWAWRDAPGSPGAALQRVGYGEALRYLSLDPSKNLTAWERDDLRAHGQAITLIWETYNQRAALSGSAGGHADGAEAARQAAALGYPGRVVMVLEDPTVLPTSAWPAVEAYAVAAGQELGYPPGGYGSQALLEHLISVGAVGVGMQVGAWSRSVSDVCHLYQRLTPTLPSPGWDVDEDVVLRQAHGQWTAPGQPIPVASASPPKLAAPVVGVAAVRGGYLLAAADGGVFAYAAPFPGSLSGVTLTAPIVGIAPTPAGGGCWLAAADGGVFALGAPFYGSAGGLRLAEPVVAIAARPQGDGYWLVSADGGVFAYGAAGFYGSLGGTHLDKPVVGVAPAPDGLGYWMAAADGGVFPFGAARFYGSAANLNLTAPVVGIAATSSGLGYWMAASDGGIFAFGDAAWHGSLAGTPLAAPVVGIGGEGAGGYLLAAADGGVFACGTATWHGSAAA